MGILLMAWLLGLGAPAARAAAPGAPAARATSGTAPVVLVGVGGLTAEDLGPAATPHLWGLLQRGASASLVVRSVHLSTCPVDGWLTLGAGTRAAQPGSQASPPCPPLPPVSGAQVPGWSDYLAAARATKQDARLGSLAQALTAGGDCVTALGPGAGIAAADPQGRVARWRPLQPGTLRQDLAGCPVTLVDPGGVSVDRGDRAAQVRALDAQVGAVLAATPTGATVIVAALADDGPTARLHPVVVAGRGSGTLASSSTRQDGYVLLTDLAPTIAAWAGARPDPSWRGATLTVHPAGDAAARAQAMRDDAAAADLVQPVALGFWPTWALLQLLGCLAAWLLARRGRAEAVGLLRRGLVAMTCVPAATYLAGLVPWWRSPAPVPTLWLVIYLLAAPLAAVALLGPWRRHPLGPPAAVAALTTLVVGGDAVTGSHLTQATLLGEQPTIGGRFYGLGNVAFSLLATSVLLLMVGIATVGRRRGRPRAGALLALAVGLAAVVVDGAPQWGADLGGPIALLPAVALLSIVALGARVTWLRVLVLGVVTVTLVTALAVLDYLRPASSRSHLGRFVQTALDGGATDVVLRKAQQNLDMLLTAPLAFLVPVALVAAAWAVARPDSWLGRPLRPAYERVPLLRAGLAAVLVMWLIGFATNDSGVAIPAVGGMLVVPLLVALVLHERGDRAGQAGSVASSGERDSGGRDSAEGDSAERDSAGSSRA
ncbi:hypothetical protein ADJ73_03685 [Arsenicicoccus sp. oral taxon 190]|nr:hypothetical protein ADJ73_03685 [Arsenicicoccus sp. oral taxon 190]